MSSSSSSHLMMPKDVRIHSFAAALVYLFLLQALYGLFIDYSVVVLGLRCVAVANMMRMLQVAEFARSKGKYVTRLEFWRWGVKRDTAVVAAPTSTSQPSAAALATATTAPPPAPGARATPAPGNGFRMEINLNNINGGWLVGRGPRSSTDPKLGSVGWMEASIKSSKARITSVMLFVLLLHIYFVFSDRGAYGSVTSAGGTPDQFLISIPQLLFNSNNAASAKFTSFTALMQPSTAYTIAAHDIFVLMVYWGFQLTLEAGQMSDGRSRNGVLHFQATPPSRGVL